MALMQVLLHASSIVNNNERSIRKLIKFHLSNLFYEEEDEEDDDVDRDGWCAYHSGRELIDENEEVKSSLMLHWSSTIINKAADYITITIYQLNPKMNTHDLKDKTRKAFPNTMLQRAEIPIAGA